MVRGVSRVLRGIAVALAVALMGAPLSGPLRSAGEHCAAACPMHARHKLGCHGAKVGTVPEAGSPAGESSTTGDGEQV